MPDNNLELHLVKDDKLTGNTTGDALRREVELLRDGIGQGVMHRLSSPGDLALSAGVAFAGAAGLRMAMDAGGKWGAAAKVIGTGFLLLGVADVTRRAVPTGEAMVDTWKSGRNLDVNKLTVANNLGTALVDYPLMAVAGTAGFRMAARPTVIDITPGLAQLSKFEMKPLDPALTKALTESGIPINQATRGLMNNPVVESMSPAARASLARELPAGNLNNVLKGSIEGLPINPATRAALNEGWNAEALKNVKVPELKGMMKPVDGAGVKWNPPENAFPKNFPEINRPNIDFSNLKNPFGNNIYTDIRAYRVIPAFPVLPVDLMDKLEMAHLAKVEAPKEAAKVAEQPKAEIRDVRQPIVGELPKLELRRIELPKIEPLPQAHFQEIHRNILNEKILNIEKK